LAGKGELASVDVTSFRNEFLRTICSPMRGTTVDLRLNQHMDQLQMNPVRDAIFAALHSDQRAQALSEFFRCGALIYVVAGALRNAIAAHYEGEGDKTPRDFDIIVGRLCRAEFDAVLQTLGRRNRHGGYLLPAEGAPNWDVWRMEDTIGLRKTGALCSIENVLRTFNLDCNAVAMDLRTGLAVDGGAIKAVRHRQVDFVYRAIRHSEETFAAKALLLDLRLKYGMSGELNRFVMAHLHLPTLTYEARKVFPNFVALPASDIRNENCRLTQVVQSPLFP
jgi:hypothetical protein